MKRKNSFDFSKHELKVTRNDDVLIHEFKRPDSIVGKLVFINTRGVMAVTGDFGNWIFCREFHPSGDKDSGVSRGYWDEKLEIYSCQKSKIYSSDQTLKDIKEFVKDFKKNYDRKMNEEEKEWVEELINNVDDEFYYTYIAYRDYPNTISYEDVPYGKERPSHLDCVYDGFDAMCEYIRKNQNKRKTANEKLTENRLVCNLRNMVTEFENETLTEEGIYDYFANFLISSGVDSRIVVDALENFGDLGKETATSIKVKEGW